MQIDRLLRMQTDRSNPRHPMDSKAACYYTENTSYYMSRSHWLSCSYHSDTCSYSDKI